MHDPAELEMTRQLVCSRVVCSERRCTEKPEGHARSVCGEPLGCGLDVAPRMLTSNQDTSKSHGGPTTMTVGVSTVVLHDERVLFIRRVAGLRG